MDEFYLDEDDLANRQLDELKEQGYKSFEDKLNARRFRQANQEYERFLSNGGYY